MQAVAKLKIENAGKSLNLVSSSIAQRIKLQKMNIQEITGNCVQLMPVVLITVSSLLLLQYLKTFACAS